MQNDSNSNSIIRFDHTGMMFPEGDRALYGVSFEVQRGEFVCIIGPSGCGKSTVLKIIAGLEKPTAGTVRVPAVTSMVFQSGALFSWLTAADNAALGLTAKGVPTLLAHREAMKSLELVGMTEFADKYPRALSGGQRQRVGIARALAVKPEVLLLDEPFSALDAKTTHELHGDLLRIWHTTGTTIVMVSHLIEEAVALADRVILMNKGTIEHEYAVDLPRPRRTGEGHFEREVVAIRKDFFR
jgi:NitT/TauT family transport system ATP-binding protein